MIIGRWGGGRRTGARRRKHEVSVPFNCIRIFFLSPNSKESALSGELGKEKGLRKQRRENAWCGVTGGYAEHSSRQLERRREKEKERERERARERRLLTGLNGHVVSGRARKHSKRSGVARIAARLRDSDSSGSGGGGGGNISSGSKAAVAGK